MVANVLSCVGMHGNGWMRLWSNCWCCPQLVKVWACFGRFLAIVCGITLLELLLPPGCSYLGVVVALLWSCFLLCMVAFVDVVLCLLLVEGICLAEVVIVLAKLAGINFMQVATRVCTGSWLLLWFPTIWFCIFWFQRFPIPVLGGLLALLGLLFYFIATSLFCSAWLLLLAASLCWRPCMLMGVIACCCNQHCVVSVVPI